MVDTTFQRIEVDSCLDLWIVAASDLVSCSEDASLLISCRRIPYHLGHSPGTKSPWEVRPWTFNCIKVVVDLIKAPRAVANILVCNFLELEHVPEEPLDVDVSWPESVGKCRVISDIPGEVKGEYGIGHTFLLEYLLKVFPHPMILFDGSFVLLMLSIHIGNVAIRLVSNHYKHLVRCCRFDGFSVLLDLPPFAGLPVLRPDFRLDAVEEDTSVVDEIEFSCKLGIVVLVELPVDVERLPVVGFELIRIYSFFPASFEDSTGFIVFNGCTSPHSSLWRHETWSLVHAPIRE